MGTRRSLMIVERRSCLRNKVHGPAFASFDGVMGGGILYLSEQGLSMQTDVPAVPDRRVHLRLDLPGSAASLETTGYIAWADALGRAGVRFSELPEDARQRLNAWLAMNPGAPGRTAPKLLVAEQMDKPAARNFTPDEPMAVSLEPIGTEPELPL